MPGQNDVINTIIDDELREKVARLKPFAGQSAVLEKAEKSSQSKLAANSLSLDS
jgi:hypothetical protein